MGEEKEPNEEVHVKENRDGDWCLDCETYKKSIEEQEKICRECLFYLFQE